MLGLGNLLTKSGVIKKFPNDFSFNFDGSNDYLEIDDNDGLDLTNFTLSAWIKLTDVSDYRAIISKRSGNDVNYSFFVKQSEGKLGSYDGSAEINSSATVNDGNWHHVVQVHNSGTTTFYIDGSASGSGSQSFSTNAHPVLIGEAGVSQNDKFLGNIDEVAVWDTALSASDVAKIASKPVDLTKASKYATDRTGNLKLYLRCGDKAEPESNTAIARQDFYTDFDGTDDVVLIEDNSSFDFGTNDYTMMGWAKTSSSTNQTILAQGQSGAHPLKSMIIYSTGHFRGNIEDSSGNSVVSTADGGIWDDGNWHHFAIVFKYGDKMYRYVDGENVGTNDSISSVGSTDSSLNVSIGGFFGGSSYNTWLFNGQISNTSVYQTAIDAQTISQMAKSRFTPMRDNRFSVVDFDGSNDHINIDGLSFSGDKGTFAFWVNSTQVSAVKHLIDIADADGGNDVQLSFQANSGNQLGIRIGASYTRYSFSNHNDGNWHHVVFVLDGTSGTIYVDGVSETKTIASSLNIVNATKAKIGSDTAGTNRFYDGALSSVSVYNVAKTEQQVYALYQKGITYNESSESDLFAYYRMGDDTSKVFPTIADSSSNSNDGTMTNMASEDIVQQMVAGYDLGAFDNSSEELGAELVTNGTFDSNINDWGEFASNRGTETWSNGRLRVDQTTQPDGTPAVGNYYSRQYVNFFEGKIYKLSVDVFAIQGTETSLKFIFSSNQVHVLSASEYKSGDTYTAYLTPTADVPYFLIGGNLLADIYELDNISIKEVLQSEVSDTYPAIIDVNEPVLGVESLTDGDSLSTSKWGANSGQWTFSGGKGVFDGTANAYIFQTSGNMANTLSASKMYNLTFTISEQGGTGAKLSFYDSNNNPAYSENEYPSGGFDNGTHSHYFVTPADVGDNGLSIFAEGSGGAFKISNISLKQVLGNVGTMTNFDNANSGDIMYGSVLPDQSFLTGVNSAYNFIDLDGSNEYIVSNSNIGISGSNAFTMMCWFNLDVLNNYQTLMASGAGTGGTENTLVVYNTNKLAWNNQTVNNDFQITSGTTFATGTWYHGAITYDGNTTIKLYVNGAVEGTKTDVNTSTSINITNSVLVIGRRNPSQNDLYLNGQITQCSVFNKELSSTEVNAIYNLTRHGNLLDSYSDNLIAYWAMSSLDSKTGLSDTISTIYDRSGNSNHATPQNAESTDLKSSPNAQPEGYAKQDVNRSTTTP